jgi:transcriptional regulator with XRE-family HTH domain
MKNTLAEKIKQLRLSRKWSQEQLARKARLTRYDIASIEQGTSKHPRTNKLLGLAKEVRCSPHTLRHTNATLSLLNGARDWEVQELLGHTTETMTKKYRKTLQSAQAIVGHQRFSPVDHLKF